MSHTGGMTSTTRYRCASTGRVQDETHDLRAGAQVGQHLSDRPFRRVRPVGQPLGGRGADPSSREAVVGRAQGGHPGAAARSCGQATGQCPDTRQGGARHIRSCWGTPRLVPQLSRTGSALMTHRGGHMTTYPVLPLTDAVLLPGMVIPVTLDSATQAAVDAARTRRRDGDEPRVLAVPRLDGTYGPVGTVAVIEQVGRLPSGEPAAVVRGLHRARIGSGVPGPGAALWVESTAVRRARADRPHPRAGPRVQEPDHRRPAAPRRLAGHRRGRADDRPGRAGRLGRLRAVAVRWRRRPSCSRRPTWTARLELLIGWAREHIAELEVAEKIGDDVREGLEKSQREFLLRQQLARDPQGAGRGRARRRRPTTAPGSSRPTCPRRSARRRCARWAGWSGPATQSPESGWIRTWLDTVLELPWNDPHRGQHRPRRGPRGARRRPRRPDRREGPHPRVPGRAQPPGRAAACRSSAAAAPARCWPWSARPASARPASASRWPARWAASSSGSRWAACATRRRSAVTGAPTSARCPAGSCGPSARPAR